MKTSGRLGSLEVGDDFPVRVMAAINLSPESFYKGSIAKTAGEIATSIGDAVAEGADFVDLGGMSTAPYLRSEVSEETELARLRIALNEASEIGGVRISVDTLRAPVAEFALGMGASIVNDVSGLRNDPRMAKVVADHGASLVAMAKSDIVHNLRPIAQVRNALAQSLKIAESGGIDLHKVVLDPGIGFFREAGDGKAYSPQKKMPWHQWDVEVLSELGSLRSLGHPLCVGLSRKSFLGNILGLRDPEERLSGSLAATAIAVENGADVIRTHDVRETVQAIRIAEALTR